jgi:hypothetical protein
MNGIFGIVVVYIHTRGKAATKLNGLNRLNELNRENRVAVVSPRSGALHFKFQLMQ